MEQPYKTFNTGIARNYYVKSIGKFGLVLKCIFFISIIVVASIFFTVIPNPPKFILLWSFTAISVCLFALSYMLDKYLYGVKIKMYEDQVLIGKAGGLSLKPGVNEIVLMSGRRVPSSAGVILTYSNISSIRRLSDEESFILKQELVDFRNPNFLSDFNCVVEITTKELLSDDPRAFSMSLSEKMKLLGSGVFQLPKIQTQNQKLLVSVDNPDDFIQEINKKIGVMV